ncbi:MAG: hypothetical protein ACTSQI_22305 [Candidatus Helarchaeota archaeon]
MVLFKISTLSTIGLNTILIPLYIIREYAIKTNLMYAIFLIMCYVAAIMTVFFACLSAVRIRSGFKGKQLRIGKRHLHEGTIGIVLVFIGVTWNVWHWFDPAFSYGFYFMVGWIFSVGGLVWIVIGAVLIGRDWEDVRNGRFFNKEND